MVDHGADRLAMPSFGSASPGQGPSDLFQMLRLPRQLSFALQGVPHHDHGLGPGRVLRRQDDVAEAVLGLARMAGIPADQRQDMRLGHRRLARRIGD